MLEDAIAKKQAERKKAQLDAEKKAREAEEERKMRKELRQGGGFNLAKYN